MNKRDLRRQFSDSVDFGFDGLLNGPLRFRSDRKVSKRPIDFPSITLHVGHYQIVDLNVMENWRLTIIV